MAKYEVSVTKVFGVALTNTATIEAKDLAEARDNAKHIDGWDEIYSSMTKDNLSDSYEFAEIAVNGRVMEDLVFSNHLLREAVEMNKIEPETGIDYSEEDGNEYI